MYWGVGAGWNRLAHQQYQPLGNLLLSGFFFILCPKQFLTCLPLSSGTGPGATGYVGVHGDCVTMNRIADFSGPAIGGAQNMMHYLNTTP
jgi:hypothetical protein